MTEAEFSRALRADEVPADGAERKIAATEAECAALAARLGLLRLRRVESLLRLSRTNAELHVGGILAADITQSCVVTLEPLEASLSVPISRTYRDAPPGLAPEEVERSAEDEDEPTAEFGDGEDWDWMFEGRVDLGEIVAEELALALDPYPRAAGVSLDDVLQDAPEEPDAHPFAELQRLKVPPADRKP